MRTIERKFRQAAYMLLLSVMLASVWAPSAAQAATAEQVDEVRQLLEQNHVSKPDDAKLNDLAIEAMIESLHDPYTEFFDADEWETFSNDLEQHFTGVGIVLVEEDGIVYVEDTIPGGPAEIAGILPGDALTAADGASLQGLSISEVQKKLLGKEGTNVNIGVTRDGKRLDYPITRKAMQLPIAAGHMMDDGVGYVSLSGFTSDAGKLFAQQVDKLEKAGMTSLLIDLRNNGGGYVNAAQQMAGLFIDDGVLAHLRNRDGSDTPLAASGGGKPYPVTILVNANSASASELFAGALQDYGIAKIVGTKTYGKGVVQSIYPLESGGVIKVTVQEYFTPNGNKVDKVGLTPDLAVEGAVDQLLAAYREAGGKRVTVDVKNGFIVMNGVRSAFSNAAMQDGNARWFVNLRLAAALVGASVGYDAKTKEITVSKGGQTFRLVSGDKRLINKNGWNLIDLGVLSQWFPGLSQGAGSGKLQLTYQ